MGWNGSDLTGSRKPLSNSRKKASNNSNKLLKPLIFGGLIITAITVLFILLFSNQTSDNIPSVEEEKPLVKAKPKKKNIVTIPQGKPRNSTINLLAPIIINATNKKGMQLILSNSNYPVKQPLFKD